MCCHSFFSYSFCDVLFNDLGSTVQTIDQVLQNNLTLVNTLLNAAEDQGENDLLKTYGIEKCHVGDVR